MGATVEFDVADVRSRFTSLADGFAFFDGPGGTQTPDAVADAIADTARRSSANLGAPYATSRRVGEILERAEQRSAEFLGCAPEEVTFGMNMTSLNFALSRAAGRDWSRGDRIIVSALDHEANVAPWHALADDLGLDVQTIALRPDTTLDLADLEAKLSDRTRLVAFTAASNALGTMPPVAEISRLAHSVGALSWVDAVHYAAHEPVDVHELGADVLLCSAYKFCGPHLGIAYVDGKLAAGWRPYKVRIPAPSSGRNLSTGTFPFELLGGLLATFDYLDQVGGIAAIADYERLLMDRLLERLPSSVRAYGLPSSDGRAPTMLLNVAGMRASAVAERLAERRIGVWSADTWYCLGIHDTVQTGGESVRVGISHYNDAAEVDRLAAELERLGAGDSAGVRPAGG